MSASEPPMTWEALTRADEDGGPLPSRSGNIGGTVTDYEIGRCTSRALTEVRTVLSRAETALSTWSNFDALVVVEGEYFGHHSGREVDDSGYVGRVVVEPHPDIREMQAALEKVVELLSPWRRTGRPKRGRVAA